MEPFAVGRTQSRIISSKVWMRHRWRCWNVRYMVGYKRTLQVVIATPSRTRFKTVQKLCKTTPSRTRLKTTFRVRRYFYNDRGWGGECFSPRRSRPLSKWELKNWEPSRGSKKKPKPSQQGNIRRSSPAPCCKKRYT